MTTKKTEHHLGEALGRDVDESFHTYEFPSDEEVRKTNEAANGGNASTGVAPSKSDK